MAVWIEAATQAWGQLVRPGTNQPLANSVPSINTTVRATASDTGTVIAPADWKSDKDGLLPGFVAEGSWLFIEPDGQSRTVEAISGTTGTRVTSLESSQTAQDAKITVVKEAGVDVTYPEYNAPRNLGTDAKASVQAAINYAATAVRGEVIMPHGGYLFNSGLTIPDGLSIDCPGFGNGHNAALYHNFNGDLLTLQGGASLRNMYLLQNGAFTGTAIKHVTPSATSLGFFDFDRIVVTDLIGGGWERDLVIDGTLGSIGVRSLFLRACQLFGATTVGETVVLKKIVHFFADGFEIVQAPSAAVCGMKIHDAFSEDIYFSGASIDGDVWVEAAGGMVYNGRVRQGRTITCAAGSDNNVFNGDVDRAAFVNNGGSKNRREGGFLRAARVKKTAAQSIANVTFTALAWDAEDYDTDALHDNVTNNTRLTAPVAGKYRIEATVVFAGNITGERAVVLRTNGATYAGGVMGAPNPNATSQSAVNASATVALAAGDYVECMVQQASGGALDVVTASSALGVPTHFAMERIG